MIQNEIISPKSPLTKIQYPISSPRLVNSICWIHWIFATYWSKLITSSYHSTLHKWGSRKFLLYSGASISLLSNYFFQQVKQSVHYTRISFNVKITTVNSEITCSGCINLSFKIGKIFYKHSLFLVDIPEHSKFVRILAFNFLKTHCVESDFHNNQIKINNTWHIGLYSHTRFTS